jgi:hypothetical protein
MDRGIVAGGLAAMGAGMSIGMAPTFGLLGLAPVILVSIVLLVWGATRAPRP